MWWPRPRWKCDLFTNFALFLIVTITTSTAMADEGQLCDGSNMSAVVWTTALCTMLLILVIVAIYFVYCKKREHSWSSLWWNSSDKNIVLQTSPPAKDQLQKNRGTDNPAFSVDANVGDCVTETGLTRIVRVPSSTVDGGSLGIELSMKEDGKKIYVCKQNDGSKENRLVALRLMFDKDQNTQPSDLSRVLVELSHNYGLNIELEIEEEAALVSTIADSDTEKCAKSNIFSAVKGKAQRFWDQRQFVFKGGDNSGHRDPKVENTESVESGCAASTVENMVPSAEGYLCSVTTVDETTTVRNCNSAQSNKYNTLEYGATPADAEAQSSPDNSVQCCSVNPPDQVPLSAITDKVVAEATDEIKEVVTDKGVKTDNTIFVNNVVNTDKNTPVDKDVKADKNTSPEITNDNDKIEQSKTMNDEQKHAATNPPPPPPRKYNASVVTSAVASQRTNAAAVTTNNTTSTTTTISSSSSSAVATLSPVIAVKSVPLVSSVDCSTPDKAPRLAKNEIRVDDDYYWCTTTAMAMPPSMSTFGKRSSVTDDDEVANGKIADNASNETTVIALDTNDGGPLEVIVDNESRDVLLAAGTTSIEDASLPPFSSDDDDDDDDIDDNACSADIIPSADRSTDDSGVKVNGEVCKRIGNGEGNEVAAKVYCNGESYSVTDNGTVSAPVATDLKTPTKLPTLRLSLSSPPSTATAVTSYCSSSASSTSSTSSSSPSPTNNVINNNSPIISKIPVRRQSAGNGISSIVSSPVTNSTVKKAIPLPLSRSGSRLAMWSSAN